MKKLFIFILFILPQLLYAQVSVNPDPLDHTHRNIEKLIHFGLVKNIIVGYKPYSRREMARVLIEALKKRSTITDFKPKTAQAVDRLLNLLSIEFKQELIQNHYLPGDKKKIELSPLNKLSISSVLTNSSGRGYLPNGNGFIDAQVNSIHQYSQGRKYARGGTFSLETEHWLRATDYLALAFSPRAQLGIGKGSSVNENHLEIRQLYGKLTYKNLEVLLGRDYLNWGQGLHGGFLLSNNGRALDMFKISNDRPFRFPWIFKYMGNHKLSFIYADLGPEQFFPHSYLAGFKWSLQPASFMEFGFSVLNQAGGEGSPDASVKARIFDIFNFETLADQISNRIGGFDFRFRIPPWRGLELYGEAIFDDIHSNPKQLLFSDGALLFGAYLPRLKDDGSLDLRIEFHRTGNRYYRHGSFQSGWTLNQFILGDPLGPDAYGLYVNINWEANTQNSWTLSGSFESRSADLWNFTFPPFRFYKVFDGPEEKRYRGKITWLHNFSELPLHMQLQFAYERVHNFSNIAGQSKNNLLGGIEFVYRPKMKYSK